MSQAATPSDGAVRTPIIDIDTHFTEPADLWTSRAPAKYRDRVLHTKIADGVERWYLGDSMVANIGPGIIANDEEKKFGTISLPTLADMSAAQSDPAARLRVMDQMGISAALMYPNVVGFGAARLMNMSKDADLRLFHIQAYNDSVAELQKEGKGRLYPQAVLPMWDMDATLAELTRVREKLGLTGVALSDAPQLFGQPSYADPVWDRFFRTCEDLRLPINFHVGAGESDNRLGFWGRTEGFLEGGVTTFDPFLICYVSTQLFLSNVKDILNLLLTGVLDKFPNLKFVSVESGVGYIPFLIRAVEWTIEELLPKSDRAKFKRRPSEMFKEQIYASFWFEDAKAVETYVEAFGSDNLLFETDFPHPQCLFPGVQAKIDETLGRLDPAVKRKILFENAAKLYGISVQ